VVDLGGEEDTEVEASRLKLLGFQKDGIFNDF